ncbi:MAG TPA: hypothetical protein VM537_17380 [Anaerolineae bacterium]|nr:hypothetical protein [Anaerolineae bacterium]
MSQAKAVSMMFLGSIGSIAAILGVAYGVIWGAEQLGWESPPLLLILVVLLVLAFLAAFLRLLHVAGDAEELRGKLRDESDEKKALEIALRDEVARRTEAEQGVERTIHAARKLMQTASAENLVAALRRFREAIALAENFDAIADGWAGRQVRVLALRSGLDSEGRMLYVADLNVGIEVGALIGLSVQVAVDGAAIADGTIVDSGGERQSQALMAPYSPEDSLWKYADDAIAIAGEHNPEGWLVALIPQRPLPGVGAQRLPQLREKAQSLGECLDLALSEVDME